MHISGSAKKDILIVTVSGKLDSSTAPELAEYFDKQVEEGFHTVILDMKKLDYISSAGLRLILNTSKLLKSRNQLFTLCRMQDHIREVFEISGFDTFVTISSSLQDTERFES